MIVRMWVGDEKAKSGFVGRVRSIEKARLTGASWTPVSDRKIRCLFGEQMEEVRRILSRGGP